MPIPGGGLEAEMMVRLEVAARGAPQAYGEKDRSDDHMEAVKPGRHEKGRGINAARAGSAGVEAEAERGVRVFVGLYAGKADPEQYGQRQTLDHSLAVAFEQRMVRPGHRGARQKQDERVEKRQTERIERVDALGRPHAGGREQARRKEGPEEGREEHYLGGNEQGHAIAQPELHERRREALKFWPAGYGAAPHGQAGQQPDGAGDEKPTG